ncbi:hypothetical protein QEH48_gp006 [Streptomyces phage TurkishDelight]|uniref:Uncharacterized protein n=1 Tax=Streptomyces phage TurkishDelight TaxID=2793708 RepID=A0A7T0M145_9CAUD|nr:hypothetical protein QEH48_gp006 [Streptomyces phage TurkishDelight]QPL14035.1 hypothetical protein SEA_TURKISHDELIGHT_6 [Streptomyces phage TurkishDelight]
MSSWTEFLDVVAAAPPVVRVELETSEVTEVLFYGPGPEYEPGGLLLIPAGALPGSG